MKINGEVNFEKKNNVKIKTLNKSMGGVLLKNKVLMENMKWGVVLMD